jgi:broad specificity phosphatase PhoE/ubiquinone/menaquinone biosynthesis C-methylase UbiE
MAEDSGLTELGWQQAHLVADWLAHTFTADALVCSSLTRARQTADVIGQQLNLRAEVMPGLGETQLPYWQEFPTIPDNPLAMWDQPWQPDAAVAPLYTQFRQSLRAAVAELMERYLGKTVIVVSHGGAIGTILRSLFGGHQMPIFTENCGVTHLVWQEGRWRLISHNERAHLGDAAVPALLPWSEPGPNKTVVEQFQSAAAAFPLTPPPLIEGQLRSLISLAAPRPTDHLLDAGTGAGAVALAFAPRLEHVTAVDISPAMLERAELARLERQANNVDFRWADVVALPYPDGTFDIVACRDLAHYIPYPEKLFQDLRRVLRPTGKLVLDEVIGSENPVKRATHQALEIQRDPAIARLYSESEIEQRIREAGFRVERAETYETPMDLAAWLATSTLSEEAQAQLTDRVLASIEGDATGLRIQRGKGGTITLTPRRVRLLARCVSR